MKKQLILVLSIFLFAQVCGHSQNWVPKYSVRGDLDAPFHGYGNYTNYKPWAIADTLINPLYFDHYEMGMKVVASSSNDEVTAIYTTGILFVIYKNNPTFRIKVFQMIPSDQQRLLVDIYFLKNDNTPYTGTINTSANYQSSEGRTYFKDNNSIELRINGDGLLMIRPIDSLIKKIKYKFNFYPGYAESSPKIPKSGAIGQFNKEDVSHLFIDEYGGFGVYLLDNEKELYDETDTFPSATYSLTTNQIFWTSFFPPKNYNYSSSYAKKFPQITHNWYSYVHDTTYSTIPFIDKRLKEDLWTGTMPRPDLTYWLSGFNSNTLTTYINANFPAIPQNPDNIKGLFIHFGDLLLWKNWQFEYIPRKTISTVPGKYSLLNQIGVNLHNSYTKYIVYTSPQYFLKGSKYSFNDPYKTFSIDQLTDVNDVRYTNTMQANIDSFTFNKGTTYNIQNNTNVKIPILNNFEMQQFNKNSYLFVDLFMKSTNHNGQFTPANREGENMWEYLKAIDLLKDSTNIDGIYMDTFYELNIPRTYQLMRELKKQHGDNFILYRHASGKEGQDAYLPQIDAYADFVLTGEGNHNYDYYDRKYMRFFVSTQNISNSVAVLDKPNYTNNNLTFFNQLYDYNIRLSYPTLKASGNKDVTTDWLFTLVNNFYSIFPDTNNLKTRVNSNLTFHQPSYEAAYSAKKLLWYGSLAISNADKAILKGDIDGDGAEDLIIRRRDTCFFFSRNDNINNKIWKIGNTTDTLLIGDFNRDNRADLILYSSVNGIRIYRSESTSSGIFFPQQPNTFSDLSIKVITPNSKILVGDFNGDAITDLLAYKNSNWKVYPGYGWGFDGAKFDTTWGNYTGDTPLVGDFNGDGIDDIAIFRNSGFSGEWLVSLSNGSSFSNSPTWYSAWGNNNGDEPLIGNFDGGFCDDIMIHRNTSYPNWFVNLSNWMKYNSGGASSPQFVETAPYWTDTWGNLNGADHPFILDFNGDGYDDYGIINGSSIVINYVLPAEIRSSATGLLPKKNGNVDIPLVFKLAQNFPNPFNPVTTINYSIPSDEKVTLDIYNILGQKVLTLLNEFKSAGNYSETFNAPKLASGIYIYSIKAGKFYDNKKMILLK